MSIFTEHRKFLEEFRMSPIRSRDQKGNIFKYKFDDQGQVMFMKDKNIYLCCLEFDEGSFVERLEIAPDLFIGEYGAFEMLIKDFILKIRLFYLLIFLI